MLMAMSILTMTTMTMTTMMMRPMMMSIIVITLWTDLFCTLNTCFVIEDILEWMECHTVPILAVSPTRPWVAMVFDKELPRKNTFGTCKSLQALVHPHVFTPLAITRSMANAREGQVAIVRFQRDCANGFLRKHFYGAVQSMLAIVEVGAFLLDTPLIFVEQWPKTIRKKNCIWINLDCPGDFQVHAIFYDRSPECHKNLSVQSSAEFTSHLTSLRAVNLVSE
jgi:hypothetical protein